MIHWHYHLHERPWLSRTQDVAQNILHPVNKHTDFMHFVWSCTLSVRCEFVWSIYPYRSGLLHWHWAIAMIVPLSVKEPWMIWGTVEYQTTTKYIKALLALCEGNHRSPVDSPHKGQWRGALMFSLICAWTNGCANNLDAGDLTCHRACYDVTVMCLRNSWYVLSDFTCPLKQKTTRGQIVNHYLKQWCFAQPFVQAQIKENIKAPRHWPLWGEFTGDRWIPLTEGQ